MHGHTGFLITTRRLAPGVSPPERTRRPAKGSTEAAAGFAAEEDWDFADLGERPVSEKKVRRVRRTVTQTSEH
jgi:tRNA (adenine57-N1/adenine58-N1)-methyltransferase